MSDSATDTTESIIQQNQFHIILISSFLFVVTGKVGSPFLLVDTLHEDTDNMLGDEPSDWKEDPKVTSSSACSAQLPVSGPSPNASEPKWEEVER